ncbi:7-cyano-7-deazaguanine synthase [Limnothrix sp. FACHB-881]|uniref:7-cyano-7-deazaguanine synthase n=1 Tax=Limnothrix sp. FACHB-881 TaxID=2692819 RepID=UPI00351C0B6D
MNLLLSGGIDSTALVAFYISQGLLVKGFHFNYGHPSSAAEKRAVKNISSYYKIPVTEINLGLSIVSNKGEYYCRNAILLFSVASLSSSKSARLAIGIHKGTPYYDSSKAFVDDMQRILDGYFSGSTQIEAPFLELTKSEILSLCDELKVPVEITYSCERNSDIPCGECSSCIDRRILNESE